MIGIDEDAPPIVLVTHDGLSIDVGAPGQRLVPFFFDDVAGAHGSGMAGDFNDQLYEFRQVGVQLVGVSVEREATIASFASAYDVRFPLVSDADRQACLAFGLVGTRRGRPRPATFMIDTTGVVRRVFSEIPPYGHAQDVLVEVRALWGT